MRKIPCEEWIAKDELGKDVKENTIGVVNVLMTMKDDSIPKGLDTFRMYMRLAQAIEKADKTKLLELEEAEYVYIKKRIEGGVPAVWGMNKNIAKAINSIVDAKQE